MSLVLTDKYRHNRMIDYSNSRIYKLTCNVTGLVYVGSTTQPLYKRKNHHKCSYRRWQEGNNAYITSFKIIEGGNYDICLLEEVRCENKEQLHAAERRWIESIECVNKVIPTRTLDEYLKQNRDKILAKHKEYDHKRRDIRLSLIHI